MYLRYREPAWESSDLAETASPRGGAHGHRVRQHDLPAEGSKLIPRQTGPVNNLPFVSLAGVKLHAVTEAQTVAHILDALDAGQGGVVVTPNLDHLRRYCRDLSFGALIAEADLVVADGMPLVWASKLQGTPLPQRVPGSNLISSLTAAAGGRGRSVFLLGGDPHTAEGAAAVLKQKYPSARIAGCHFPPFGFQDDPLQMSAIVQALSDTKPDIVFVALGSPKQEKLIARLRPILPQAWWLGVGNSFSFLAGHVKRAPVWMQRIGLEWLHRLCQEPRRLFKRYLIVGVPFAAGLLLRSAFRGVPTRWRKFRAAEMPAQNPPLALSTKPAQSSDPALSRLFPMRLAPEPTCLSAISRDSARRLRALVLLGGSVRTNQLSASTGRSVLDLPLDQSGSILSHWLNQALEVARWAGVEQLPVRVLVNQNAHEPHSAPARFYGQFRVERDSSDYRGTGGVLRDIAAEFDDRDLILVVNAAQILLDPLQSICAALHTKGGDVALVSHQDGTPSGIMLVGCNSLRLIPPHGFVDMKEQALPLISSRFDVRVLHRRRPTALPVRSLTDYIQALRYHHRIRDGRPAAPDPLAENFAAAFGLVEEGAVVDTLARVHDSVVLRDARVDRGAVLVRSLVCGGARVTADRTAVDQIVTVATEGRRVRRAEQLTAVARS